MYSVRLRSGARHGETPRIGGNPKNQPISELDIFSKRQALSRAVVGNSNMSRGKYLAREGPGSRLFALEWSLRDHITCRVHTWVLWLRLALTQILDPPLEVIDDATDYDRLHRYVTTTAKGDPYSMPHHPAHDGQNMFSNRYIAHYLQA